MKILLSISLLFSPQQILHVAAQVGLHSSYVDLHEYGLLGVLLCRDQGLELYSIIWPIRDALDLC